MKNESPTSSGKEAMTNVQFLSRSNFMVNITMSKIFIPMERSCHKECTCKLDKACL